LTRVRLRFFPFFDPSESPQVDPRALER